VLHVVLLLLRVLRVLRLLRLLRSMRLQGGCSKPFLFRLQLLLPGVSN